MVSISGAVKKSSVEKKLEQWDDKAAWDEVALFSDFVFQIGRAHV